MSSLSAVGAPGRVNGLVRGGPIRRSRLAKFQVLPRAYLPFVAVGSGLYAAALLSPVAFKQVTPAVVLGALIGTGLLLYGLHLRWTKAQSR